MLALIAGRGALPEAIAAAQEGALVVCALQDDLPERLEVELPFRIEVLGSLLEQLRARGVTRICMAGAINRPRIDPTAIDAATLPLVPVLTEAARSGDDGALRALMGVFETAGFEVVAAHEAAPSLLLEPGVRTTAQPGEAHRADAARGAEIVAAMASVDIGQACAVLNGQALAVEGVFGTDWMLAGLAERPDGGGGLLFKAPKPGQDRRADLPTIGPETIRAAAGAGLEGVVIEAGGVIVLDQPGVIGACDRMGLFLWAREPQG